MNFKAALPLGSYCSRRTVNGEQHTGPRGEKKLGQTLHSHSGSLVSLAAVARVSSPFTASSSGILKLIVKHTGFNIIPEIHSPNKADDFLHIHPFSQIPLSLTSFIISHLILLHSPSP